MGYNRSGVRRTARLKRRKRFEQRLAEKAAANQPAPESHPAGLVDKVKDMAKTAVEKVEGALHTAAEKIKGALPG
jgi:hypothetical protein